MIKNLSKKMTLMSFLLCLSLSLNICTVSAAEQNNDLNISVTQSKEEVAYRITHIEPMPEKLVLTFAGDMNLDESWYTTKFLDKQPNGIYDCISPALIEEMKNADIFMPNNEFTYSTRGAKLPNKAWTFRAKPSRVNIMKELGTDIVLLANNHCYDYGPDSLYDTLSTLDDAKIPYVGAGRNLTEAMLPYYFHYDGLLIAYVAASQAEKYKMTPQATDTTPGILRCYDMSLFLQSIRSAASVADIVIANIHWGTEGSNKLEKYQQQLAYQMIDAGADAIIGSHPHVLQGIEYYKGKPIMYSLGNYWFNASTMYTCLFELEVDTASKSIEAVKFIPATQTGCRTLYASTLDEQRKIFDFEQKLSVNVTIDNDGYVHPKN